MLAGQSPNQIMSVEIFNTLTRKKEKLDEKLNGRKTVRMYSCGVTVYDRCHIGHARSLYVFDVIRRYLEYRGYEVKFVRNITDIDDKIINRAKELKKDWKEVVDENIASYQVDLQALGIAEAEKEPRATENIDEMKKAITALIEKGYAYVVDGDVYYAVRKFKDYGKLSHQDIEQMEEAVRIDPSEKKKDPLDFALWKKSKEGEPSWPSPWGQGRPGWHMECSCMSLKHLNCETLDIHAGGQDLVFPHHENEIAQSEAWTGKQFAKLWIHHGLLTINGQKMSKSSGNFITIQDAIQKYGVEELKLFYLASQYGSPIDFVEKKIFEARKQKDIFIDFLDKFKNWQIHKGRKKQSMSAKDKDRIKSYSEKFIQAMDDNFNTPVALASLFELVDFGATLISLDKEEGFREINQKVGAFLQIFGLNIKSNFEVTEDCQKLIDQREEARRKKEFEKADKLREEIVANFQAVVVDTAGGVTFTSVRREYER